MSVIRGILLKKPTFCFLFMGSLNYVIGGDRSPFPLWASISGLGLTLGMVKWWHTKNSFLFLLAILINLYVAYSWRVKLVSEKAKGEHNTVINRGFRTGVILFILSEVLFFFSFFWGYFHNCWSSQSELGFFWPPFKFEGIVIDPFSIPLLNTVVLLSSGARVTWCHQSMLDSDQEKSSIRLILTCLLGVYFLYLQGKEYICSFFSLNSNVYGSIFFLLTGFHGFHVTIGTVLLICCLWRLGSIRLSKNQHVGFEASAWYWHFVDVVWLFLYLLIYWYGFRI